MGRRSLRSCIIDGLNLFQGSLSTKSMKYPQQDTLCGEIIIQLCPGQKSGPGKTASVRLCSSSDIDPDTRRGKLTDEVYLKNGKIDRRITDNSNGTKLQRYEVEFNIETDFGNPGALVIRNNHKRKFFLQSASLQVSDNQMIHFECNSWIYPFPLTKQNRIFFPNTCYLPNQTPVGLIELRKEELIRLRGDGTGERQEWEQIYDYDYYNDLGNPDKGAAYSRHVLGGSRLYPYPRRLRTGRPSSNHDIRTESRPGTGWFDVNTYVPPDERFSQKKLADFMSNAIRAGIHFVAPEARTMANKESGCFESFDQVHGLFTSNRGKIVDEQLVKLLKKELPKDVFRKVRQVIKEKTVQVRLPKIASGNQFAWMDDEEFGRQMLAGTNPTVITCLRDFPPGNQNGVESSIERSHIEHNLEGLTIEEAMDEWRIFQLDHHDYLMPFLSRINAKNICAYASRTLLFLKDDFTLKPLVIELSLPGSSPYEEINRVFCPASNGSEAALWQLAKAHVAANDSGYHHLINHWLKTHAIVEPFIIATRRNLSYMHPIHRLLNPHFKDTIQVNALARSMVLNAGGIFEKTLFSGHISMELSSYLYKNWRFDEQSLPADLIKRGMAIYIEDEPETIELLFEDYPYAADGLDIWLAIKKWVTDYCSYFYDDILLRTDNEIQGWWREIRYVGHGDKCNETWWYEMTTLSQLIETLTTLIWTVTAFHAAVTLGQYEYAGYPLNRPVHCQRYIPEEGTMEFAEFLRDPDKYFLSMLPPRFETTLGIALVEVLSGCMSDGVFLGQELSPDWIDDEKIQHCFKEFGDKLQEIKKRIEGRNRDLKLKNRRGKVNIPYEALCPVGSRGVVRRGIPNSISI